MYNYIIVRQRPTGLA